MGKSRRFQRKFKHFLHDVMEYVRLHPEKTAQKIKAAKVGKKMESRQIDAYRMHMVMMLDYDALARFDSALKATDSNKRQIHKGRFL